MARFPGPVAGLPWYQSDFPLSQVFQGAECGDTRAQGACERYHGPAKSSWTVIAVRRRHGQAKNTGPDPKEAGAGSVRDALPEPASRAGARRGVPGQGDFFDARGRGAGQVRDGAAEIKADGTADQPRPPRQFGGTPGPRYYEAAAALERSGLVGALVPGPARAARRPQADRGDPRPGAGEQPGRRPRALRPAQTWPDRIEEAFGVRVHPRSVERALARRRERHSKSR